MPRSSYIIAALLVAALAAWLGSGMIGSDPAEEPVEAVTATGAEAQPPLVEVASSMARPVTRYVIAQGSVEAFRRVAVRTQTEGRVEEILVGEGERVGEGDPLVRLTLEGRGSRLREARAVLDQRQQDYDAVAQLVEQGYATEARARELRTLLESAREEVQRLEEEVGDATVGAPFSGVVDAIEVTPGEYLTENAEIGTLIDNSPLRVNVRINQQDVARVASGTDASVTYGTGETETGRVCFISAAADPATRTFRVEVRTPNATNGIPSGISAEARIPTGERLAHFVSPAILSLGTDGSLGVKTVGDDGTVAFETVDVVRAQTDGIWVSGLPDEARIITIGQGFVQAGDRVRISESEDSAFAGADDAAQPEIGGTVPADICAREPQIPDVPQAEAGAQAVSDAAPVPPAPPETGAAGSAGTADATEADAETVEEVQQALNGLGFGAGPVDGLMGESTRDALREFQEANDLAVTGALEPETLRLIREQTADEVALEAAE